MDSIFLSELLKKIQRICEWLTQENNVTLN